MALLRDGRTVDELRAAFEKGGTKKHLRSYSLPEYQLEIIDLLVEDSGLSKAGVLRHIIDEWCEDKLTEAVQ